MMDTGSFKELIRMDRTISMKDTVYEICSKYPEAKDILARLGFHDITKPGLMNTAGRFMTIPRGASMKGIELSKVIQGLSNAGFEITGAGESSADAASFTMPASGGNRDSRTALLKEYVARLSRGDSLEAVRADFVAHFQSVEAAEIAAAEQELISGGTPVAEVQKLCDVHSALFHGATREEQIANAEKAVQASSENMNRAEAAQELSRTEGHPVSIFAAENQVISALINETRKSAASAASIDAIRGKLNDLRGITEHYAKKGDLIYPLLKTRYNVSGPADVMWGVDDEIRDEFKILSEAEDTIPDFKERLDRLLTRAEEMVYKENNILFPLCAENFSEEDWMGIYYELSNYDSPLLSRRPLWKAAEEKRAKLESARVKLPAQTKDNLIPLGGGHMSPSQIEAVLNTIPLELSFIDDKDINRYFNAGKKLFKRPANAVDREVYSCHPPKFAAMARQVIGGLRSGARDSVDVWMNKGGGPVLVRYMAVRDSSGRFLGTLECVQKMGFAKEHFGESGKVPHSISYS